MKYITLIIIAAMLLCFNLFAKESDSDFGEDSGDQTEYALNDAEKTSTGVATDAGTAAGCERLNLGSWEGMEAEEEPTFEDETVTDEEYLRDMELYEQSKQESQKTEELLCEENPNPDGTITCYEGDKAIICQIQGEQTLCPQ